MLQDFNFHYHLLMFFHRCCSILQHHALGKDRFLETFSIRLLLTVNSASTPPPPRSFRFLSPQILSFITFPSSRFEYKLARVVSQRCLMQKLGVLWYNSSGGVSVKQWVSFLLHCLLYVVLKDENC
jgi:hypothetical protein